MNSILKITNEDVVQAWRHTRSAFARNIRTDGYRLYSFNLIIGYTDGDGRKIVTDYTKDGGAYYSMTTSHHVGLAKSVADIVLKPKRGA